MSEYMHSPKARRDAGPRALAVFKAHQGQVLRFPVILVDRCFHDMSEACALYLGVTMVQLLDADSWTGSGCCWTRPGRATREAAGIIRSSETAVTSSDSSPGSGS